MEFRLTYEGPVTSDSNRGAYNQKSARASKKHEIRKIFHPQLKRLWEISRHLSEREDVGPGGSKIPYSEALGNNFSRNGYRFCPLVTKALSLRCDLDILFLRADEPGALVSSGDIDNRLKTIFDALCMPTDDGQLGGHEPEDGEDPFYCLLEDDRYITNLKVETDTMLQPIGQCINPSDARVVISVRIWPFKVGIDNLDFI